MKSADFRYHDPRTMDDFLALIGQLEDAKILAGGQSLMPMMNMRFVQPDHVIDINAVPGLDGVAVDDRAGLLRIGAMARQKALMQSAPLRQACPMAAQALTYVGHFQTRARGTIGGSLCHLDPAAELPLVMLLHDAVLTVRSSAQTRQIAMADWALAYMLPALAPDEALIEVALPLSPGWTGSGFVEFARRHGDFAIASAGCLLQIDDGNIIRRAAVAVGGVAQVPTRLDALEAALCGQPATAATFAEARNEASKLEALSDAYHTAAYRQRLAGIMVERALTQASKGAEHG
jgi:aerobic carbon-monoxide dehydrogenase medium subunit